MCGKYCMNAVIPGHRSLATRPNSLYHCTKTGVLEQTPASFLHSTESLCPIAQIFLLHLLPTIPSPVELTPLKSYQRFWRQNIVAPLSFDLRTAGSRAQTTLTTAPRCSMQNISQLHNPIHIPPIPSTTFHSTFLTSSPSNTSLPVLQEQHEMIYISAMRSSLPTTSNNSNWHQSNPFFILHSINPVPVPVHKFRPSVPASSILQFINFIIVYRVWSNTHIICSNAFPLNHIWRSSQSQVISVLISVRSYLPIDVIFVSTVSLPSISFLYRS